MSPVFGLGSRKYWVCAPSPARHGPSTQPFGKTTPGLQRLADCLQAESAESVAMESTHVCRTPLRELLASHGKVPSAAGERLPVVTHCPSFGSQKVTDCWLQDGL